MSYCARCNGTGLERDPWYTIEVWGDARKIPCRNGCQPVSQSSTGPDVRQVRMAEALLGCSGCGNRFYLWVPVDDDSELIYCHRCASIAYIIEMDY